MKVANLEVLGKLNSVSTQEEINASEKELGFVLPPSYRAFVSEYGLGLLCGLFWIFVPKQIKQGSRVADSLTNLNNNLKDVVKEYAEDGYLENRTGLSREWLLSLQPFGESDNGDILCWDISAKDKLGEYPIYLLENEENSAPCVAQNINEFVQEFCINQKIDELFPRGHGEKWLLPKTFIPYKTQ